jgi:3-hydroxyacyl-CoA dehydrogenase/enoyl-CoA hydratase/carnithine racemase
VTTTAVLPDEVVTTSLVRDVDLPGGAGRMALITLDNGRDHTRPSTLGPAGLASLQAALDEVERRAGAGEIVAVGVTGKPFFFLAGADLSMAGAGRTRADGLAVARQGHAVFRRLGELPVPSFAFVNGAALGGGVEIALHCSYRTINRSVTAVALPECFLGLIPGWGGTYLLPNLIGPQQALDLIVANPMNSNKMITGEQAFRLGLADACLDAADFLARSLAWAGEVVTGRLAVERTPVDRDEAAWQRAAAAARSAADAKVHGAAPAPYRAIDLVLLARTASRDEGFAAEDQALADAAISPEFRRGLYAFDLVNKRARRPAGAPPKSLARPVTSIGVVGAGLMASQLALLFVRRLEVPVVLTDLDAERVQRGVGWAHAEIATLAKRGRLSPDAANRLTTLVTGSTDPAAFAGADLVIEAVFEQLEVKQQVLAQVEAVVRAECVLLSNTSSLSITAMAAGLAHPERVVGLHFFNPVAVLPLVEVVRGEATDEASLATALAVGAQLGKSCVLVKDAPAFVVNRLLNRLMGEVTAAVDGGADPELADHALDSLGLPMTPFVLLQLVGPAVALHVAQTLHDAHPDRFTVSANLRALVAAGLPGLYSWGADGKPFVAEQTRALLTVGEVALSADQVRERALRALAQECRLLLDEGVVAAAADIDLCLLLGAGWPFHLGGITPYLDDSGAAERAGVGRFSPRRSA